MPGKKNKRLDIEKKEEKIEKIEHDVDKNEDDYIDPESLNYDNYEDIIEEIEYNGWTSIMPVIHPITHLHDQIVFPLHVKKNTYESILKIICPAERIITVCGFNQCNVDKEDFFESPNLFTTPHFLTLRCTDDNNNEISARTIISISKFTKDGELEGFYQEFYGDLSPTIGEKLKIKRERYYLADTIILQNNEQLVFQAHYPDKDISRIELLMMAEMFKKDIGE